MGINKKIFLNPVDDYECGICKEVAFPPCTTSCGDLFCKQCINEWLSSNVQCPKCKTPNPKIEENSFVQRMINNRKVNCPNNCELFKGTVFDLHQTHKNECPLEIVECTNANCTEKLIRKELDKHREKCMFRLVPCKYCSRYVIHKNMQVG